MATKSTGQRTSTPFGRDEVAAAVLEAASDLFAEKGPAATSIREVAARSKVNHGLVFRHFGAKDNLVGAVLDHLAGRITAQIESQASGAEVEEALIRHAKVVARAILDGYPVGELQSSFPTLARLLDEIRPNFDTDVQARLAAANIGALQLGWYLFRPFLQGAMALEPVGEDAVRASITAVVAEIGRTETR